MVGRALKGRRPGKEVGRVKGCREGLREGERERERGRQGVREGEGMRESAAGWVVCNSDGGVERHVAGPAGGGRRGGGGRFGRWGRGCLRDVGVVLSLSVLPGCSNPAWR